MFVDFLQKGRGASRPGAVANSCLRILSGAELRDRPPYAHEPPLSLLPINVVSRQHAPGQSGHPRSTGLLEPFRLTIVTTSEPLSNFALLWQSCLLASLALTLTGHESNRDDTSTASTA